eukprot:3640990-Pleurochrysis_carterae.AAC.10
MSKWASKRFAATRLSDCPKCRSCPTKDLETVERKSIFLVDVELTFGGRLNKHTKDKIVEALRDEHKVAYAEVPKTWKQGEATETDAPLVSKKSQPRVKVSKKSNKKPKRAAFVDSSDEEELSSGSDSSSSDVSA